MTGANISVIPTVSGTFNIFGVRDDTFVLQGNLTEDELDQLAAKIAEAKRRPSDSTKPDWLYGS